MDSASGSFVDQKKPFTAQDIRFTTKGDVFYAIALGQPAANTMVKSLGTKAGNGTIESVALVGSNEKLSWTQEPGALNIKPSKNYPSGNAVTYKIIFKK